MKVAFLDRDGTLIYEPPDGIIRPENFRILPGVFASLKSLKEHGYKLVMITNQDLTVNDDSEENFKQTQKILLDELAREGIAFDEIFLCPHSEEDHCNCRKPKTGMVDAFFHEHDIDLSVSFVVGDRENADGGFAQNIRVRYIRKGTNDAFPSFEEVRKLMNTAS
ncbi:hypothetical protein COU80_02930 [Candidatus Peregrinibacteria bacterium CG10_big_fil_rev_8_21_14_0_10_55_24]|nr:MAG: hypothetical protein COU80_02930 [Candidatus Peregrinibacteria bacterium CG10_big_fil_rev_8_21_14_0_10_55_24]